MIRLYDAKKYFSPLFRYPSIVIADNGLIYPDGEQDKLFPQAIGKIDWESGKIYGDDYDRMFKYPIGRIVKKESIVLVYGKNYDSIFADPIGVIKDDKYYTAENFYKIFGSPDYYIKKR